VKLADYLVDTNCAPLSAGWPCQTGSTSGRSAGAVDLLIAATAEYQSLSLLHHDRDFDQIAGVTGHPMRWLAPAGTIK
jgi:predicted nuclease of predicted toxin-antitoxin system